MTDTPSKPGLMARLGLPQREPPWPLTDIILTLAVLMIATLIIATGITANITADTTNPDPTSLMMGWLIGLVIVVAFVMVRWRRDPAFFAALRLTLTEWHPLLAVLVGLGGAFAASVVVGLGSDFLTPLQVLGIDRTNIGALLLACLFVLLVQPVAEGLVFYGVILPRLRATLGSWPGILLTIVFYAAYFYIVYGTRTTDSIAIWHGMIYPVIVGFTLVAIRIWSQSTLTAIMGQMGVGASILMIMSLL